MEIRKKWKVTSIQTDMAGNISIKTYVNAIKQNQRHMSFLGTIFVWIKKQEWLLVLNVVTLFLLGNYKCLAL